MIEPIKIIAVIFVIFVSSRAFLRFKDKKISIAELLFWLCIWFGLVFVVFFPDTASTVANMIGIGRGADFIIYFSIAMVFYLIFRLYVKLEEVQREITVLVREIAISKKKKE
jgi:small membrane protein